MMETHLKENATTHVLAMHKHVGELHRLLITTLSEGISRGMISHHGVTLMLIILGVVDVSELSKLPKNILNDERLMSMLLGDVDKRKEALNTLRRKMNLG
jgi:hypothetical protein